jgi:hypothetical protein
MGDLDTQPENDRSKTGEDHSEETMGRRGVVTVLAGIDLRSRKRLFV